MGKAGIDGDRPFEFGDGLVGAPQIAQYKAQIVVGFVAVRLDCDGFPEMGQRFFGAPERSEQVAQTDMGVGVSGLERHRPFKRRHRRGEVANEGQCVAKIVQDLGAVRFEREGAFELTPRRVGPADFDQRVAEVIMKIRILVSACGGTCQQLGGAFIIPGSVGQDPLHEQAVGMIGVGSERRLKQRLCLGGPTGLGQAGNLRECLGRRQWAACRPRWRRRFGRSVGFRAALLAIY